jgi:hypothetical protein
MLGSTSLIETSLDSGSSLLGSLSNTAAATPRPEDTLATFLLHVVGAAVAKLHQQASVVDPKLFFRIRIRIQFSSEFFIRIRILFD